MLRYTLPLLVVLLSGCAHRDCARSAATAQVQVEAVRQQLSQYASTLTDVALHDRLTDWTLTLEQAEVNITPAVTMLAEGEKVEPVVTVEQVISNAPRSRAAAAAIGGRAEKEVEDARLWWQARGMLSTTMGAVLGGDWLSTILAGGGGVGLVAAFALKAVAFVKSKNMAIQEAVQTGEELAAAKTKDAIDAVKENAALRQAANGTKAHIDTALKKVVTPVVVESTSPQA